MRTLLIFATLCFGVALAQTPSADLYTNGSSDGSNVYVTSVIQAGAWTGYAVAYHTYSQSVKITSPDNRTGNCGYSQTVPSNDPYDYQCTAQLSVDNSAGGFVAGDYVISGYQSAVCSQVGQFAYAALPSPIKLVFSSTWYQSYGGFFNDQYIYNRITGCQCTCLGADQIYRNEYGPYWILVKLGASIFGLPAYCTSRVLNDQSMDRLGQCGDTIYAP